MSEIKVTYIDHMGDDLSVVNAARVSFGKKSEFVDGEIKEDEAGPYMEMVLSNKDKKLIRYLAKHKHLSPFGHAFASFHVKARIFVARQLVKHKFLRWNEISRRYVDEEPEFYMPDVFRGRSADKKQGSEGVVTILEWGEPDDDYDEYYPEDKKYLQPWVNYKETPENLTKYVYEKAKEIYNILTYCDVCPEQARMVLPQSTMTEWYWSGSLDAFAAMCKLRCAGDTQYESRIVADQISELMKELFPVSWEALME